MEYEKKEEGGGEIMSKQKLCEWSNCELQQKQKQVEVFIEELFKSSLKLLQYKYPNHNKDCLQRIFAERLQTQHHYLIGELIDKDLIKKIKKEKSGETI
tara:strand:+ start:571 stop:867 length:297 start_codon:yes stop_codon:yes gene_type:complete